MSDLEKIQASDEHLERMAGIPFSEFAYAAQNIAKVVERSGGRTVKELSEVHENLGMRFAELINDEAQNAVEQAALLGMVGCSLLTTFDRAVDYLQFQAELYDLEDGGQS